MTNSRGMEVRAMNYGGIIVSLRVPDKKGVLADVVLGFDTLDAYLNNKPYFGAIIGRYANRISSYHRRSHASEPHQSQLFQSCERGKWRYSQAQPDLERRPLYPGGQHAYSGRRTPVSGWDPFRLHKANCDRSAHRHE